MQAYMEAVTGLARRLLRIIAIALTLPPDFFLPQFDKPLAFLRPLHYSPQVSIPEEVKFVLTGVPAPGCTLFTVFDGGL